MSENLLSVSIDPTPILVAPSEIAADFDYEDAGVDRTIDFTDTSEVLSGNVTIIGWVWDFGDGETETTQDVQHLFAENGSYDVTLVITASDGVTSSVTKNIKVGATGGAAPVVDSVGVTDPAIINELIVVDATTTDADEATLVLTGPSGVTYTDPHTGEDRTTTGATSLLLPMTLIAELPGGQKTWQISFIASVAADYSLGVRARNVYGTDLDSQTLTVVTDPNAGPEVTIIQVSPQAPQAGSSCVVRIRAIPPAGGTIATVVATLDAPSGALAGVTTDLGDDRWQIVFSPLELGEDQLFTITVTDNLIGTEDTVVTGTIDVLITS